MPMLKPSDTDKLPTLLKGGWGGIYLKLPHLGQQVKQRRLLFPGSVEEGGYVPLRDDQAVARGDGVVVVDSYGVGIGRDDWSCPGYKRGRLMDWQSPWLLSHVRG